ncbi:MAG: MFS transporter, partial [Bacteroidia bacterium]|nr:MFS transporter [Bacteroidia bacterium]
MFTRTEKIVLALLAMVQFTHILDFMILMPLGAQIMRIFEISPSQFSRLVSAYTLTAGAAGFLSSFWVDRFDRKKIFIVLYLGFALGTLACALSTSYYFFLIARAATGAFGGVLQGFIFAIVADTINYSRRGQAMGVVMTGISLASVFGVPFSLFIAAHTSWHVPFLLVGGLSLVGCAAIWRVIANFNSETPTLKVPPLQFLLQLSKNKNELLALLAMFFLTFGHFAVIPFISPYLVSNVGFEESQLSLIYLFGGGLTLFTSPLIGKIADKYGKQRIFTQSVFFYLLLVFAITNMPHWPVAVVLVLTTTFFIFSHGRMVTGNAIVTSSVSAQKRGSFMSLSSCVQNIGAGLAAMISGSFVHRDSLGRLSHFNWSGYWAIAIGVLSVV